MQEFWKKKALDEMTAEEWESLCDGCAKCCLNKLEDEDSGEVYYTNVRCEMLDPETCRCTSYLNRVEKVPSCVVLGPSLLGNLPYMPKTCSYRLIFEGKDLPEWHHLISGDRDLIHKLGHSVKGKTISESEVVNWEEQVIDPQ